MIKKVLITGGAGFIGSAITAHLFKKGYSITVVDNLSFGTKAWIEPYIEEFHEVDIRDFHSLGAVFDRVKPDMVIHLAAIHFIPYCNTNPFEACDVNITGTNNVIEVSRSLKHLDHFIFASTAAVYPIMDNALNETIHPKPMDIYGSTKLAGERMAEAYCLDSGVKTTVTRFFNAFGPNETNPHLIPEIENQLKSGKRILKLGNLEPKRDFIHTYDMANAIEALLLRTGKKFDTFNLGRGIEYSVIEIVRAFEKEMKQEIKIEVEPARIRKIERMHLLADVSKLKKLTGWEPSWSLEQGIRSLMETDLQR